MIGKLIEIVKRRRRKAALDRLMQHIEMGRSILDATFSLRTDFAEPSRKYLTIGHDSVVGGSFVFESKQGHISIGDRCYIGSSTFISRESITIGDDVTIAWGATIYDHNSHSIDCRFRQQDNELQLANARQGLPLSQNKNWSTVVGRPIVIEDLAWIGMNAIILKGVTIGRGAIVAAASVVVDNVEPWTIVGGNPARVIKQAPQR